MCSEELVHRHERALASAKYRCKRKGRDWKKKQKVTAHAAAKRVPAPVNTVPLSELVNTFCKWAPDADANCWSGSVVEDVWTTPGVGMQLGGGGGSSLTLHPLSSRSASQTAVPEILFFSPKIRPLFSVGLHPHESGWTVRPNIVIKTYLFCACYLPVTQCDKWSVLTPQTSGRAAASFFLLWYVARLSVVMERGLTQRRRSARPRPSPVCLSVPSVCRPIWPTHCGKCPKLLPSNPFKSLPKHEDS